MNQGHNIRIFFPGCTPWPDLPEEVSRHLVPYFGVGFEYYCAAQPITNPTYTVYVLSRQFIPSLCKLPVSRYVSFHIDLTPPSLYKIGCSPAPALCERCRRASPYTNVIDCNEVVVVCKTCMLPNERTANVEWGCQTLLGVEGHRITDGRQVAAEAAKEE